MRRNASRKYTEKHLAEIQEEIAIELDYIHEDQSKKKGAWTLLIVTVALFFLAGFVDFSLGGIIILVSVLLVHELGHLLTMKLLKYSDVKMFFIPFLGAAVSGKSKDDSALKSCIVSLMGPFPGILLAIPCYFLFPLTKNYYFLKTAEILIFLNVFNLLPIMPLDGGRIIDAIFVNNRFFRLLFSLFGALVFLLLAYLSNSILFAALGVLFAFGALSRFKIHTVARDLKRQGFTVVSLENLLNDPTNLNIALRHLLSRFPRIFEPKVQFRPIYDYLAVIVETIRFIPAKLLTKVCLTVVYAIVAFISIIILFVMVAPNYYEQVRVGTVGGQDIIILEKYVFGDMTSECPVNESLYYDGRGISYFRSLMESETKPERRVECEFFYKDGFRDGVWLYYNREGDVINRDHYENGNLVTRSVLIDGEWATTTRDELPFFKGIIESISEMAQPFKSNHMFFSRDD